MDMKQLFNNQASSPSQGLPLLGLLVLALLSGCKSDTKPSSAAASISASVSASVSTSASLRANDSGAPTGNAALQASSPTARQDADHLAAMSEEDQFRAKLMKIVFGDKFRQDRQFAIADMPDGRDSGKRESYLIQAVAHKQLDDGRMILLTNSQMHDEQGQIVSGHGSPGILSVFAFAKHGQAWQVEKRHEHIAELGSDGRFGLPQWVRLGGGKPGMVIHSYFTGQGQFIDGIALFKLGVDKIEQLGTEVIPLESDNDGACLDETEKCWHVEGKYHFAAGDNPLGFDDLVLDFKGYESTLPEKKGKARVKKTVKGSARYRFDGKAYALLAGENLARND